MTVELKVGGKLFGGWKGVRVQRGIEQVAGSFELFVTDRWNAGETVQAFELKPGQACEVLVNGEIVITGYHDAVSRSYDKSAHQISVSGRDKTGDLVDCSAIYKTGQWTNKTIAQIGADLIAPFGIGLVAAADIGTALPVFAIQEGETVFEALERAARMKALLLVSDGRGNLVLTRAGNQRAGADLVEGSNILSANGEFSWKDRFSDYVIKGQRKGNDEDFGEVVAQQVESVTDSGINRYRPLVIMAEDQDGNATLRQRAEWERNVRAGRGTRATVTVQGWAANGQLWQPNTLTRLRSPYLAADLDVLIVSVTYSLDDNGTTTTLELANPSAFDTIQQVKQTRLEKKLRQKDGKATSIVDEDWQHDPSH